MGRDTESQAAVQGLGRMSLMERQCLIHCGHRMPECREVMEAQDTLILRGYAVRGPVPMSVRLTEAGTEEIRRMLEAAKA